MYQPQVRSGPQRTQPRQQRPPPPHSSNNGRNPPPPPVPHTHPPPVAETSNGPNPSAPLNNQVNFSSGNPCRNPNSKFHLDHFINFKFRRGTGLL